MMVHREEIVHIKMMTDKQPTQQVKIFPNASCSSPNKHPTVCFLRISFVNFRYHIRLVCRFACWSACWSTFATIFVGGEITFRRLEEQAAKKFAVFHLHSSQNAASDSDPNYRKRKRIPTQNFFCTQKNRNFNYNFFPLNISNFCLNLVLNED